MLQDRMLRVTRQVLLAIGRLLIKPFIALRVEGKEHLPPAPQSLLLIANHFSWFDPPVLALALPFHPAFLVATEAQQQWWLAALLRLFECIPIWRGQVDRQAIRTTLQAIEGGKVVAIFPEGGVNPDLAERVARGETIAEVRGNMARLDAQLAPARSGAALIAVMSGASILPVALYGTETILQNLRRWRRPSVTVRIGPIFGPLKLEPHLTGQARRRQLDALAASMMHRIAELFPPEQRGYYSRLGE